MREGGLESPVRRPILWQEPDYNDADKLDAEMRRVFDICHGCRRCFNLCDTFPRLFDLIDESRTGELDSVASTGFKAVVDGCTLCDMCFMTKCPYVPPHEFDLDFPHLMLRYRAAEAHGGRVGFWARQLTETDRNGRLCAPIAGLVNWAARIGNRATRPLMAALFGIVRGAAMPAFHRTIFVSGAAAPEVNRAAPGFGRKAVLYATCFVNYNEPGIGAAARAVLAKNGVETEILHPGCCGMPKFEQGDLARVAEAARRVSRELLPWVARGYAVIALVPSCALMLKFEWPLLAPGDEEIRRLAEATFDLSEYIVDIARTEGLAPGLAPLPGGVTVHLACHARAQNMGPKAAEMLRLVPRTEIAVIERCSGHGGSWGVMKGNFETAIKHGRPVARQAMEGGHGNVASECPLAAVHIGQGMERLAAEGALEAAPGRVAHPIELMAESYGLSGRATQ